VVLVLSLRSWPERLDMDSSHWSKLKCMLTFPVLTVTIVISLKINSLKHSHYICLKIFMV